jgi:hypothetical protein
MNGSQALIIKYQEAPFFSERGFFYVDATNVFRGCRLLQAWPPYPFLRSILSITSLFQQYVQTLF